MVYLMNLDLALGTILNSLLLEINRQFFKIDDLAIVWNTLQEKYDKVNTHQLAILEQQLYDLNYDDFFKVEDFLCKI